jgi:ribosomal protein S18 acetylase RimI-like enzyme
MLRSATQKDLNIIATWIASPRECRAWAGPSLHFPLNLSTLAKNIGLSPTTTFCLGSNAILAFGQLRTVAIGRGHLARIIVAPTARRAGHGSTLMHSLLDLATQRGLRSVGLNVKADNIGAQDLYRRLGFRVAIRPRGYRQYMRKSDGVLCANEEEARSARRGLWSLSRAGRVAPWEYRKRNRNGPFTDYSASTISQCVAAIGQRP